MALEKLDVVGLQPWWKEPAAKAVAFNGFTALAQSLPADRTGVSLHQYSLKRSPLIDSYLINKNVHSGDKKTS